MTDGPLEKQMPSLTTPYLPLVSSSYSYIGKSQLPFITLTWIQHLVKCCSLGLCAFIMQSVRVTVAGSSNWNMTGHSDKVAASTDQRIKYNLLCRLSARAKRKFIYAELTSNLCLELTRSFPTMHKSYPGACTCTNMFSFQHAHVIF